jgi:hypothetical protein
MWVKVAAGTSVVAVSLIAVCYVTRLPSLTIASVEVTGTALTPADSVESLATDELEGSYALIVPYRNAFLAPTKAIRAKITEAFPAVATVSITEPDLNTLAIAITERTPSALWCPGIPSGQISSADTATGTPADPEEPCYEMDDGGFIFATATPGMALERYFGAVSGQPIGSTYLPGDFASLRNTINGIAASIRAVPSEVLADAGGTDVSVAFQSGGVLRFTRSSDQDSILANVASVFASQSFKDHPNFEYVDFRFGDKVYVKFK